MNEQDHLKHFKNSKLLIAIIVLLSFLPLYSIFKTTDLIHTHDGLVHLARIAAYFKALSDGQFPVRWAGDLNYGYGMPIFNFIYQLPYAIASFFLFLGFGLVNAFKLTLSLSYLLSGIFMFLLANSFFKNQKQAFLITIFYQFATFRLVEMLVRGSFGEVYTYTFLPLVLFGITKIIEYCKDKKNKKNNIFRYFILASASVALLILSHNSLSLVFFSVCLLYVAIFARGKALIISNLSLFFGVMISAFYWLPAIIEHKYTYGDLFMKNLYLEHFVPITKLILPNLGNSSVLQVGGISVQIGILHILAILISVIFLILKTKKQSADKKMIIFCISLTLLSIFFILPTSKFLWSNISYLRQFQFPWRFLGVIAFTSSILAGNIVSLPFFRSRFVYIAILIIVIGFSVSYWKPLQGYQKISEIYYWNYPMNTTYYGETDLIWSAGGAKAYPKNRIEVIDGKADISNYSKKSYLQDFNVNAKKDSMLVAHTQFFPGWKVYVDGIPVNVQFQNPNWRGQMIFQVLRGNHHIRMIFGESRIRFFADTLSFLALIGIFPLWLFAKKYKFL